MVTTTLPIMSVMGDKDDADPSGAKSKRNHQSNMKPLCRQHRFHLFPTVDDDGVPIFFWKRLTTTRNGHRHRTVTGSEFVNNFAWAKFNWLYEGPPPLIQRDAADYESEISDDDLPDLE